MCHAQLTRSIRGDKTSVGGMIYRILIVGDGDLSFSLALHRAYGDQISITATTVLESYTALIQEYPHAMGIVQELQQQEHKQQQRHNHQSPCGPQIRYGIDATQLPRYWPGDKPEDLFDLVMFQYPHLGDYSSCCHSEDREESENDGDDDNNNNNYANMSSKMSTNQDNSNPKESLHARNHYSLLAHYFAAAKAVVRPGGCFHVTLRIPQVQSWHLDRARQQAGLIPVPIHQPRYSSGSASSSMAVDAIPPVGSVVSSDPTTIVKHCDGLSVQYPIHWLFQRNHDWKVYDASSSSSSSRIISKASLSKPSSPHRRDQCPHKLTVSITPKTSQSSRQRQRTSARHWLSKYGYKHQMTFPPREQTITSMTAGEKRLRNQRYRPLRRNVDLSGSFHFIFTASTITSTTTTTTTTAISSLDDVVINTNPIPAFFNEGKHVDKDTDDLGVFACMICGLSHFTTGEELLDHYRAPALPIKRQRDILRPCRQAIQESTTERRLIGEQSGARVKETVTPHTPKAQQVVETKAVARIRWTVSPICQLEVTSAHDGKRLRWYMHHHHFQQEQGKHGSLHNWSKRDCERLIQDGMVAINEAIVTDSSRIVRTGDILSITVEDARTPSPPELSEKIDIVDRWSDSDAIVVWKPVGMRTMGMYDKSSLEYLVSQHSTDGPLYRSLSKLDKGVSGLCVLSRTERGKSDSPVSGTIRIRHCFTALVHGRVPECWDSIQELSLPIGDRRRWKRSVNDRTNPPVEDDINDKEMNDTENDNAIFSIRCLERAGYCGNAHVPLLSTLSIETECTCPSLGSLVVYFLRKRTMHPVVGDRFATGEYLSLPRSIQNRLKHRLCIGCTRVEWRNHRTLHPIPDKWSAAYWERHAQAADKTKGIVM